MRLPAPLPCISSLGVYISTAGWLPRPGAACLFVLVPMCTALLELPQQPHCCVLTVLVSMCTALLELPHFNAPLLGATCCQSMTRPGVHLLMTSALRTATYRSELLSAWRASAHQTSAGPSRLPSSTVDTCLSNPPSLQAQGHGLPLQSISRSCILSASLPIKLDMDIVGLHHESAASRRTLGTRQVQAKVAAITVLQEEVSSTIHHCNKIMQ